MTGEEVDRTLSPERKALFDTVYHADKRDLMESLVRRYSLFYGVSNERAGTMIRADLRAYIKRLLSY